MGPVDVDDFCNYMADMEDAISVSFQITRFGYGRGNYQRMEIYGSEGAIVYSLDAQPGEEDVIEVCTGDVYAEGRVFSRLPIPDRCRSDQMRGTGQMACPVRAAAFPTDNASAPGRICQDPAEGGEEHLHHHDDREGQAALNIRVTLRVHA